MRKFNVNNKEREKRERFGGKDYERKIPFYWDINGSAYGSNA